MAKEYKDSHSTCLPDLVTDTTGQYRWVFPSSDAGSTMDERKLGIKIFKTDSDSLSSKGGASTEECNSMADVGSSPSSKKSAWNKPSSHGVAVSDVGGIVMDADSWPTLSESARASPKSPSAYPAKRASNGPIIAPPQGIEMGSSSSTTKEAGFRSLTPKPTPVHVGPTRGAQQKKRAAATGDARGGGGGSSTHTSTTANGSLSPQVYHQPSLKEIWSYPLDESFGESSTSMEGHEQARKEQQHPQHNGSSSRNSNGPQLRGNGSYNSNNNVGRRDPHRVYNNKGNHGPQQRGPRPVTHSPAPYMQYYFYQFPYPAMPPYVPPEMMAPYFWHPPPLGPWRPPMSPEMLNPQPEVPLSPKIVKKDPELSSKILKQIDYYFSLDNLVKDTFLRENMDAQGWVPINLIANFDKVAELTDNVQEVLDAIRSSSIVEVQDNKVRCRENWKRWIIPKSIQGSTPISPHTNQPSSSQNSLSDKLNNLNLG